jgi:hypothetical protein
VSEDQILQLIAYIQSLQGPSGAGTPNAGSSPSPAARQTPGGAGSPPRKP